MLNLETHAHPACCQKIESCWFGFVKTSITVVLYADNHVIMQMEKT